LTLHHDLLEQAQYLAYRESGKPRQASLRRAVSAAYYSLFHLLLHEATHLLFPAKPTTLRDRARRAFTHSEAKNVCETFARKEGGIKDLTTQPLEQQLSEIAATFVELQEARQRADYDLTQTFERSSGWVRGRHPLCDGKMGNNQEQAKRKCLSRGVIGPQQME